MWSQTFSLFISFLFFLIRLWLRALWVMVTLETLQLMTSPWHQAVSLQSVSRFVNSIQQSADINLKAGSTVRLIWTCLIKLLFMFLLLDIQILPNDFCLLNFFFAHCTICILNLFDVTDGLFLWPYRSNPWGAHSSPNYPRGLWIQSAHLWQWKLLQPLTEM